MQVTIISVATGDWRGQLPPPNLGQADPWDLCKTEEFFSRGGGGAGVRNVINTYFVSAPLRVFSGALWTVLKLFLIVTSLLY